MNEHSQRAGASTPSLIAVAHGTRCAMGQAQVRRLVDTVRRRRPGLDVHLAYLDIERPHVRAAALRLGRPAVAVPLLFTAGYHVRADLPAALHSTRATAAPPLGPDPALTTALLARLDEAGALAADGFVLAAAGSREPSARADVRLVATDLAAATSRPVLAGYASAATPRVATAVAALRAAGARRVAIAPLLLADGQFHQSLLAGGGDAVAPPLGDHPAVVDLILRRHAAAAHVMSSSQTRVTVGVASPAPRQSRLSSTL
ncbi:MAG: sirohydrochlorin chelatase [Micromonosporaceae bacterium]